MQLINAPVPFSPAFGEILYTLSLSEEEKGEEISIFNSAVTEKIGIKKAADAPEFSMNVSDYVRSQIRIEPFPWQDSGIIEAIGRTWYSCIAHQDWASINPHTAGIVPAGMNELLCENIIRYLGDSEQDEICWIAGEGPVSARILFPVSGSDPVEIPLGQKEVAKPKILALILNSKHLNLLLQKQGKKWNDFSAFSVEIYASYELMARLEYRIRPHNCSKTRFGWWNRQGGIDFYSFEVCRKEEMQVVKQQLLAGEKKVNLTARSTKTGIVATACTTRKNAEWIARIAAAPQVWIVENEQFVPVGISSLNIPIYDPDLSEVEIHFEYSKHTDFQSF